MAENRRDTQCRLNRGTRVQNSSSRSSAFAYRLLDSSHDNFYFGAQCSYRDHLGPCQHPLHRPS